MEDTESLSAVPPAAGEPLSFQGMLPGDAQVEQEDESAVEMEEAAAPTPNTSTSSDLPTASTSAAAPTSTLPTDDSEDIPIVTVTSHHPTNGKSRDFYAKYFKPVLNSAPTPLSLDLPESYFSPTATELQTAFAGQVKKREALTDAPLLTKALRERDEASKNRAKAAKWPNTRIRIRFNDRSQLESVFASTDSMAAVYEFVKCSIKEEHRQKGFLLYHTPPRQEFKKGDPALRGKSLMDLQFTPSSVFYIKFDDDALNVTGPPPLIPELIGAASDLPLPPTFDPTATDDKPATKKTNTGSQKLGFGGSSGKVTPSWLKIGKSGKK